MQPNDTQQQNIPQPVQPTMPAQPTDNPPNQLPAPPAEPLEPATQNPSQSSAGPFAQVGKPVPTPQQPPQPKRNTNSTQNSLLISEIRDNLVIMNDGSMRAVVACRSINFDLMSAREREAVEYSYQNFINSLYFPVQILIRSQKVDIGPYLDRLGKIRRDQDNMLLGVLMDDYIDFIGALAQETNIMDKSFFIVTPYYPTGDINSAVNTSRSFLANLFAPQSQQRVRIDETTFNKSKDELRNRVQTVMNGLLQLGIRSSQLSTKELGELYYNVYNPDTAVREPLGNFADLAAPITTKGTGQAPQPHLERGAE